MSDNITLPREVMKNALHALEDAERNHDGEQSLYTQEIEALRTALATPKQEPSKQEALCWFCHGIGYQLSGPNHERVPCPSCNPKEYFK